MRNEQNVVKIMKYLKLLSILALLPILSCSDYDRPADYFPLKLNNTWLYTGTISKIQVTEESKHNNQTEYILSYYDSTGIPVWQEKHIRKDKKIFWESFVPQVPFIPAITFNPPLPAAAFSDKLGDKKTVESVETRSDSANTTANIVVDYEIVSIENVELPSGFFPECIKVRVTISYPDPVAQPYLAGTSYYWFARGVGPVSYILPSGQGGLMNAKIGNKKFPS